MRSTLFIIASLVGFPIVTSFAQAKDDPVRKPSLPFKSSIQVPEDKDRPKPTTKEEIEAEERRLLKLAKITPDEAKATGTAAYDGVFKYVKIHNYDGNLAYEVEFKDGLELIIDAGNKAILQIRIERGSAMDKARKSVAK